jgi:anti-sigma B factor antagonist
MFLAIALIKARSSPPNRRSHRGPVGVCRGRLLRVSLPGGDSIGARQRLKQRAVPVEEGGASDWEGGASDWKGPAVTEKLSLTSVLDNDAYLVRVGGEVDMYTAPQLRDYLSQLDAGDVVIDLSDVGFLDSLGVAVLVKANERTKRAGQTFTIVGASARIRKIFELTGLGELLQISPAAGQPEPA